MSWRAAGAIASAVATIASIVLHDALPARAQTTSATRVRPGAEPNLLHEAADTGVDIVRMPRRRPPPPPGPTTGLQPPTVSPPVAPPPASPPATPPATSPVIPPANQPPQPQGRVVKVATKIGALPRDPQKGWLGVQMDALELPLALSLGLPNANGVLILEAAANSPAGQAGLRFGDVAVGLNGRPVATVNELRQRVATMSPGSDAELEVWRVTEDGGDFLQTLRRLGESGNAHVMFRLGRLYATGSGVARDDTEAVSWYRKGAAAGNTSAMAAYALALLDGRGTAKDPQEGIRLLRSAAEKENPEAMFRYGLALVDGNHVAKDPTEAMRLFTKTAEAGHVPSMLQLGLLYNSAENGAADPANAALWYKRAADLGNSTGMVNLGFMHQQGKGVERNEITAVALYRKAAAEGNPSGIHNLAAMLDSGRGVAQKDPEQAAELMMQALDLRYEFSINQMMRNSRAWSSEFRRALQRRLRDAGVYSGKVDGEMRDTTIAAINAYVARKR